jgi:hypothetical protein
MIAILQFDSVSIPAFNHMLAGDRLPTLDELRRKGGGLGWKSWTDVWQRCALVQSALDCPVHGVKDKQVNPCWRGNELCLSTA